MPFPSLDSRPRPRPRPRPSKLPACLHSSSPSSSRIHSVRKFFFPPHWHFVVQSTFFVAWQPSVHTTETSLQIQRMPACIHTYRETEIRIALTNSSSSHGWMHVWRSSSCHSVPFLGCEDPRSTRHTFSSHFSLRSPHVLTFFSRFLLCSSRPTYTSSTLPSSPFPLDAWTRSGPRFVTNRPS